MKLFSRNVDILMVSAVDHITVRKYTRLKRPRVGRRTYHIALTLLQYRSHIPRKRGCPPRSHILIVTCPGEQSVTKSSQFVSSEDAVHHLSFCDTTHIEPYGRDHVLDEMARLNHTEIGEGRRAMYELLTQMTLARVLLPALCSPTKVICSTG